MRIAHFVQDNTYDQLKSCKYIFDLNEIKFVEKYLFSHPFYQHSYDIECVCIRNNIKVYSHVEMLNMLFIRSKYFSVYRLVYYSYEVSNSMHSYWQRDYSRLVFITWLRH